MLLNKSNAIKERKKGEKGTKNILRIYNNI